jgi:hypothetical protein
MSLGFPRNAGNFLTGWGTTCLQTYIRTPFPAFPYKRVVMAYGMAHALTYQERLCSMELFLMLLLFVSRVVTRETNSLIVALSYSRLERFLTWKHFREQNGQEYGHLTDICLGAHPVSFYVAQRHLPEAFSTCPEKSAQLRVPCEQLHTQPWRLLWFRHRSVNKIIFIKSRRRANTSLLLRLLTLLRRIQQTAIRSPGRYNASNKSKKGKIVPIHAVKAHGEYSYRYTHYFNLGAGWSSAILSFQRHQVQRPACLQRSLLFPLLHPTLLTLSYYLRLV